MPEPKFSNMPDLTNGEFFRDTDTPRSVIVADDAGYRFRVDIAYPYGVKHVEVTHLYLEGSVTRGDHTRQITWPVTVLKSFHAPIAATTRATPTGTAERLREEARGREVEDLAQTIRRVDGAHKLGAGALAEAIIADGFLDRVGSNR